MTIPEAGHRETPTLEQLREFTRSIREIRESRREAADQMKETDRRLKKAEDLFTTQWGKLMESWSAAT